MNYLVCIQVDCIARAGMSRSATVVAAWLLNTGQAETVEESLDIIKKQRPMIKPNLGFLRQLKLFAKNPTLDTKCPHYVQFAILHGSVLPTIELDPSKTELKLKCRKCRAVVAVKEQILHHSESYSPDWCPDYQDNVEACKLGVFIVNPARICQAGLDLTCTNRFDCGKCKTKIGNIGLASCGCGADMQQCIWINYARVDPSR